MAQENIDFGAYPNDPDADAIRTAFQKVQNNFIELYAIQYSTGVSQVNEGAGISVNQNTGNVTVTNRIPNITIQTGPGLLVGVTTATSNTATISSGTTPFVITFANSVSIGNITSTGNLQGTLNALSNNQPNITTVGNLLNLSVVGNISSNNFIGNNFTIANLNATNIVSPGATTQLLLNSTGNIGASPKLTFDNTTLTVTGVVSATGNIAGANLTTTGQISATGNVNANAYLGNTVSVSGNVNANNITIGNVLSIQGNTVGNNFIGKLANGNSNISITQNGNITITATSTPVLILSPTGANIYGNTSISANAIIGNIGTGIISASGNIDSANLNTGTIIATGNVQGANLRTAGLVSASGNLTSGNVNTGGLISAGGNITGANIITNGLLTASGNIIGGNISTSGVVSASSNVTGGNLLTGGLLSVIGNITAGNANLGNLVSANFFSGNAANLFGIPGGNIVGAVSSAGVAFYSNVIPTNNLNTTFYVPFVNTTSGNANLNADSLLGYNPSSKVLTANSLSVVANIVAGNINLTSSGTITVGNLTTGANTTNGYITGNWALTAGSRLTATYADLAENYAGDQVIESGTIVEFGGENEVTICLTANSTKVAGVVSSEPAYIMNGMIDCEFPVAVALQGRVPTKVTGSIKKGDLMVSAGNGLATACNFPVVGSVIGKSLENFDGAIGTIEIAIGRL